MRVFLLPHMKASGKYAERWLLRKLGLQILGAALSAAFGRNRVNVGGKECKRYEWQTKKKEDVGVDDRPLIESLQIFLRKRKRSENTDRRNAISKGKAPFQTPALPPITKEFPDIENRIETTLNKYPVWSVTEGDEPIFPKWLLKNQSRLIHGGSQKELVHRLEALSSGNKRLKENVACSTNRNSDLKKDFTEVKGVNTNLAEVLAAK
ncbi:hypothetical protein M9H77_02981 [Catharanthus roseus]|uniref:Uncharacterized protein n=1 Tax=Catharanthus roseus TaxID=4058 RepID=A0ACC0CAD1_CATRO|nr:hypothetical protein M9H77_02981 [Catharanthus roseus]